MIMSAYPACMFLLRLLSPARLLGTSTKSESWSVSGLEPGDCSCLGPGRGAGAGAAPLSLVSIFSLVRVAACRLGDELGRTTPWQWRCLKICRDAKIFATCVTAGDGGSWGGSWWPAPAPGTATPSLVPGAGCCLAWARKGWLKNASKSILSLASRLRRCTSRWVNCAEVPAGIRGASFAFFS